MALVRQLVLDVLKPRGPSLVAFTDRIAEVDGVEGVTCSLIELDHEVQNVEVTLTGEALAVGAIEAAIEEFGGTVHSVDLVACGDRVEGARQPICDD